MLHICQSLQIRSTRGSGRGIAASSRVPGLGHSDARAVLSATRHQLPGPVRSAPTLRRDRGRCGPGHPRRGRANAAPSRRERGRMPWRSAPPRPLRHSAEHAGLSNRLPNPSPHYRRPYRHQLTLLAASRKGRARAVPPCNAVSPRLSEPPCPIEQARLSISTVPAGVESARLVLDETIDGHHC